jgi:hypothetical protein
MKPAQASLRTQIVTKKTKLHLLVTKCSREVGSVDPILVRAAKDSSDADSSRQLLAERSPSATGTITGVTKLSVVHVVSRVSAGPRGPALRVDDARQGGVLEDDARESPPRATKVVGTGFDCVTSGSRDLGLVDDVVGRVGGGIATVGSDVAY